MPVEYCEHDYPINSNCPKCELDELKKSASRYAKALEGGCYLNDPEWMQCCCNCIHHKPTYEHCATNPKLRDQTQCCICSVRNGWACCMPGSGGRIHTHWPEHSVGCELYQPGTAPVSADVPAEDEDYEP